MRARVPQSELDVLARVPLFSHCTRNELQKIAMLGVEVEVSAGKELTIEGNVGSEFFLVVGGQATCSVHGAKEAVFGPGDFFGELALLGAGRRTATVTATTPLTVTILGAREFRSLLRVSPGIAVKLLEHLAGLVYQARGA